MSASITSTRLSFTVSSVLRCGALCVALLLCAGSAVGQNIRGHYVSKAEEDGTIYHTFPKTLFTNSECGDLTFDLTYKEKKEGVVTVNFTYGMPQMNPVDSVCIQIDGRTILSGRASKLYIEPERKVWKHRYTFTAPVAAFGTFFDETTLPVMMLYSQGKAYAYPAKPSAWQSFAPIGFRIFEMIRVNENT